MLATASISVLQGFGGSFAPGQGLRGGSLGGGGGRRLVIVGRNVAIIGGSRGSSTLLGGPNNKFGIVNLFYFNYECTLS